MTAGLPPAATCCIIHFKFCTQRFLFYRVLFSLSFYVYNSVHLGGLFRWLVILSSILKCSSLFELKLKCGNEIKSLVFIFISTVI